MVKKIVLALVVLAAVAAGLLFLRKQKEPERVVLSGTVEARAVNLGSLVGGRVTRVHVDEGQSVAPGHVLVTLETETLDRQLAEQQAAIAAARAALANVAAGPRDEEIRRAAVVAENDARNARHQAKLFDEGVVSKQLADDAATKAKASAEDLRMLREGSRPEEIEAARAQLTQQERKLATLQQQREETLVRSTVAGTVQSFGLRPGDIVAPNQTVAEILEPRELWVRVYVPETLLGLVRTNMPVKVRVDTFPDLWFSARVASISGEGEYTPRNVQTRAQRAEQVFGVKVVLNPDPRLKPGMAAGVDLGVEGDAQ